MIFSIKHVSLMTLICVFITSCSISERETLSQPAPKQNVVMIIVDDLRPVLGAYDDKNAHTPNIDALAKQGITFKHAYTNVPVCGASRASMLTGLRPTKNRFTYYKSMAEKDAPGAKSLQQVFKESGYYTMAIGKIFHVGRDLENESWSEKRQTAGMSHTLMLNPESQNHLKPKNKFGHRSGPWYESADVSNEAYPDGKVKQKALKALNKLANNEQPFFLSVGFIRPHLPFNAPKKYYDLHPKEKFTPFFHRDRPQLAPTSLKSSGEILTYHFKDYKYNSDAFHLSSLQGYYASVSYIDALIGDIVKQIDSLGLRDNTTIVVVSDHGFQLGEHNFWTKHTMLQTSLRIPLIISAPNLPKNKKTEALVELVDIFPTLTEMAGIKAPAILEGKSFTPILKNPQNTHKKYIYSRFKNGDTIITENLSFTSYSLPNNEVEEMLYDLQNDPHETQNVIGKAAYKNTVSTLREKLRNCIEQEKCVTH